MDNVIQLNPGVVSIGSEDEPEVTDVLVSNPWAAASISAISDKAIWGCLMYVNEEGDFIRIPIKADRISLRGLFETALDDIRFD